MSFLFTNRVAIKILTSFFKIILRGVKINDYFAENMGFASASREEKLKMLKTNKTRKTTKHLNRLAKRKKLSREIRDGMADIKSRKSADLRQRAVNVSNFSKIKQFIQ